MAWSINGGGHFWPIGHIVHIPIVAFHRVESIYIHIYTCIYIYIYICLCQLCIVYVHVVKEVASFRGAWLINGGGTKRIHIRAPDQQVHVYTVKPQLILLAVAYSRETV